MATKSAISFGLVHIPISLHTATTDDDVRFNQLHRDDNSRVRYKKVCGHCGKEVKTEDIVKGYEYEDDKYVIVTDDDFERIGSPQLFWIQRQNLMSNRFKTGLLAGQLPVSFIAYDILYLNGELLTEMSLIKRNVLQDKTINMSNERGYSFHELLPEE